MLNINRNNYESIFIDYFDGQLSAEQVAELFLFLENNYDLKDVFDSFENISLDDQENKISFEDKFTLKVLTTPNANTIDQWLIADIEGELNLNQKALLLQFLKENPQFEKDQILFRSTILTKTNDEVFPLKLSLKKVVIKPFSSSRILYRIAAIILIIILSVYLIPRSSLIKEFTNHREVNDTTKINVIDRNFAEIKNIEVNDSIIFDRTSLVNKRNSIKKDIPILNNSKRSLAVNKIKAIRLPKNSIDSSETIAYLSVKNCQLINEVAPFVFVEKRFTLDSRIFSSPNKNTNNSNFDLYAQTKDFAANKVNNLTEQQLINTSSKQSKLPVKSRIIKLVAWTIEKVSNNKVQLRTEFNPNTGSLAAYELEMGKNKWQKIHEF